jgi:hypothetical protein
MATFLLIVHGLMAVTLLGGLTHQALAVALPTTNKSNVWNRFRGVTGGSYTNSIVVLYSLTTVLGLYIYAQYYRVDVRELLEFLRLRTVVALFEIKEHVAAVGLGLLPAYWYFWRPGAAGSQLTTRRWVTVLLCLCTWYAFLAGHVVNNAKGFGS